MAGIEANWLIKGDGEVVKANFWFVLVLYVHGEPYPLYRRNMWWDLDISVT